MNTGQPCIFSPQLGKTTLKTKISYCIRQNLSSRMNMVSFFLSKSLSFDDLPHFHYAFINTPYKGVVHGYINRK